MKRVCRFLIPVSSFKQGLWKDARRPNHPKDSFAKLQILSICKDHFCLPECVTSETSRLIVMQFNILLFLKICRKISSFFQIWEANRAVYVKAYCIYYNISSVLLNIRNVSSTLCTEIKNRVIWSIVFETLPYFK